MPRQGDNERLVRAGTGPPDTPGERKLQSPQASLLREEIMVRWDCRDIRVKVIMSSCVWLVQYGLFIYKHTMKPLCRVIKTLVVKGGPLNHHKVHTISASVRCVCYLRGRNRQVAHSWSAEPVELFKYRICFCVFISGSFLSNTRLSEISSGPDITTIFVLLMTMISEQSRWNKKLNIKYSHSWVSDIYW